MLQHDPGVPGNSHAGLPIKLFYGIGEIANSIKSTVFGLFILFFYTTVMGLPGTWVGIAAVVVLMWDASIDPYIGYLSDKARSRFGKRHTFMLIGSLTMGISFWLVFSPPQGLPRWGLFVWLLGTSILVRTTISLYGVPYYALGAELSQEYYERTAITGIRSILALLGTLAAASLSFVVFFPNKTPGMDPKLHYAGYPTMGLLFGLVMTTVGLIATLGTLSQRHTLSLGDAEPTIPQSLRGFFGEISQSLRNPSFRVLFISFSLFFLGVVINSALSLHYLTYYIKITSSTALSTFQLALYIGGLVGVGFWLLVSKRVEKHRLYFLSALVTASLMFAAFFLMGEGRFFGLGNIRPLLIGHALLGFFGSVLWFIPASMVADVVDEDELVTGRRRVGSFFGIFSFGPQLATGLSVLLTGLLVDKFAGLVPAQAQQSAQTVYRLGMLYGVLPALLVLVAAALILRYSLTQLRAIAIRAELDRGKQRRPGTLLKQQIDYDN
jgi:GPH family glycoside/pentoside/hexuronide:cation symporter